MYHSVLGDTTVHKPDGKNGREAGALSSSARFSTSVSILKCMVPGSVPTPHKWPHSSPDNSRFRKLAFIWTCSHFLIGSNWPNSWQNAPPSITAPGSVLVLSLKCLFQLKVHSPWLVLRGLILPLSLPEGPCGHHTRSLGSYYQTREGSLNLERLRGIPTRSG